MSEFEIFCVRLRLICQLACSKRPNSSKEAVGLVTTAQEIDAFVHQFAINGPALFSCAASRSVNIASVGNLRGGARETRVVSIEVLIRARPDVLRRKDDRLHFIPPLTSKSMRVNPP